MLQKIIKRQGTAAEVAGLVAGAGGSFAGGDATLGFSALHTACAMGWDELLLKLLEVGAAGGSLLWASCLAWHCHRRSTLPSWTVSVGI